MTVPRETGPYVLEHPARGCRFWPVSGSQTGFPDPATAMQYIFDMLPHEAHEWQWVPMPPPVHQEKNP